MDVAPDRQLPVLILTGYLGAGKTTLLTNLLRQSGGVRTAVIINELGEIPLDHDLVQTTDEEIVEVSGGCLCCTVRGDIARALHSLRARARTRAIGRVIIETTGLADPVPVIHTLLTDSAIAATYRLAGILTVVDAVNGLETLRRHGESVRQLAIADRILITKTDLCGGMPVALDDMLAERAPGTPRIVLAPTDPIPLALLEIGPWRADTQRPDVLGWLNEMGHDHGGHVHEHEHSRHDAAIQSFCIRRSQPIAPDSMALFLELLTACLGPRLLRLKAIIKLSDAPERPLVVHAVQHLLHEPVTLEGWPSADHDTRLVLIVQGIDEPQISSLLDGLIAAG